MNTIIQKIDSEKNNIYIKREDLIPYSFGGNKARKAFKFFEHIGDDYDYVVTYGSSSSNHARVVANLCQKFNKNCIIISPEEAEKETYNSLMMKIFNAEIIIVPVSEVSKTIDDTLEKLKNQGHTPYFIQGGGHGIIGTSAYVDCYNEISEYEKENNINFDYIFLASGTGTTHAGLVCGQLINKDNNKKIIGISIARNANRGKHVIIESIKDYLKENNYIINEEKIKEYTYFLDDYIVGGYGLYNDDIMETIRNMLFKEGLPLDPTYTGKAMTGMFKYISKNEINNKNILFIHTGGTPLFFDFLENEYKNKFKN